MTRALPAIVLALGTACGGGAAPAPEDRREATAGAEGTGDAAATARVTVVARRDALDAARRAIAGHDVRLIETPGRDEIPARLVTPILERARTAYRELSFEESLAALGEAEQRLAGAPDDADTRAARHQVLVLRGMNELALGRASARATFVEAARLRPRAELEESRHPPDVRALYVSARAEAASSPLPPARVAGGAEDGEALARALVDASYEAIAEVPAGARAAIAAELETDVLVLMRAGADTVALDLRTGETRTALPGVATGALIAEVAPRPAPSGASGAPGARARRGDEGGLFASPWFWIATGVVVAGGATAGVVLLSSDGGGPVGVAGSGF